MTDRFDDLSRRDFARHLSMAALTGALAGSTLLGCKSGGEPKSDADSGAKAEGGSMSGGSEAAASTDPLLNEPHVCRGLNTCKGKGKGGANACAGQGECASVASHACGGKNECKGQGGCGGKYGANDCKGKGGCAVPLMDHAWGKTRENFEKAAKAAGITVGQAPAKK